jgi:hypothetical protein
MIEELKKLKNDDEELRARREALRKAILPMLEELGICEGCALVFGFIAGVGAGILLCVVLASMDG